MNAERAPRWTRPPLTALLVVKPRKPCPWAGQARRRVIPRVAYSENAPEENVGRGRHHGLVIDANFTYEIACLGGGPVCTISGAQTIRLATTYVQGTPSRNRVDARGIRCGEGGTIGWTADYTITERMTIS